MDNERLHQQIDRFFEAELTRQEERSLFKTLLKMEGQDPLADEALAVMLASRMIPKRVIRRKRIPMSRIAGIAASIAIVVGTGVWAFNHHQIPQTFAYIEGNKTQDIALINDLIATQLQDIEESTDLFSQTVSTDLDDIREALISSDL